MLTTKLSSRSKSLRETTENVRFVADRLEQELDHLQEQYLSPLDLCRCGPFLIASDSSLGRHPRPAPSPSTLGQSSRSQGAPHMCSLMPVYARCTGIGNQFRCSKSGVKYCGPDEECIGTNMLMEAGMWSTASGRRNLWLQKMCRPRGSNGAGIAGFLGFHHPVKAK